MNLTRLIGIFVILLIVMQPVAALCPTYESIEKETAKTLYDKGLSELTSGEQAGLEAILIQAYRQAILNKYDESDQPAVRDYVETLTSSRELNTLLNRERIEEGYVLKEARVAVDEVTPSEEVTEVTIPESMSSKFVSLEEIIAQFGADPSKIQGEPYDSGLHRPEKIELQEKPYVTKKFYTAKDQLMKELAGREIIKTFIPSIKTAEAVGYVDENNDNHLLSEFVPEISPDHEVLKRLTPEQRSALTLLIFLYGNSDTRKNNLLFDSKEDLFVIDLEYWSADLESLIKPTGDRTAFHNELKAGKFSIFEKYATENGEEVLQPISIDDFRSALAIAEQSKNNPLFLSRFREILDNAGFDDEKIDEISQTIESNLNSFEENLRTAIRWYNELNGFETEPGAEERIEERLVPAEAMQALREAKPILEALSKYETPLEGDETEFAYHQTYSTKIGEIYGTGGLESQLSEGLAEERDNLIDEARPEDKREFRTFERAFIFYAHPDETLKAAARGDYDVVLKIRVPEDKMIRDPSTGGQKIDLAGGIVADSEAITPIMEALRQLEGELTPAETAIYPAASMIKQLQDEGKDEDEILEYIKETWAEDYWKNAVPFSEFKKDPEYYDELTYPEVLINEEIPNEDIQIHKYPEDIQKLFDSIGARDATHALELIEAEEPAQEFTLKESITPPAYGLSIGLNPFVLVRGTYDAYQAVRNWVAGPKEVPGIELPEEPIEAERTIGSIVNGELSTLEKALEGAKQIPTTGIQADVFERNIEGREFVIKKPKEYTGGSELAEDYPSLLLNKHSLRKEAVILQEVTKLGLEGFVRYVHHHIDEENPSDSYLIMEKVEGTSLRDHLYDGNYVTEEVVERFKDNVRKLHEAGFAHMDIKTENILIDSKTGELILLDFGVSVKDDAAFIPSDHIGFGFGKGRDESRLVSINREIRDIRFRAQMQAAEEARLISQLAEEVRHEIEIC